MTDKLLLRFLMHLGSSGPDAQSQIERQAPNLGSCYASWTGESGTCMSFAGARIATAPPRQTFNKNSSRQLSRR
jgi:hypothetical protein